MAKLRDRNTASLIDRWVQGKTERGLGNYRWVKKLAILIFLVVILISGASLWNYYDLSIEKARPSSHISGSSISDPVIDKPDEIIWSVKAGDGPFSVRPLIDQESVYIVTGQKVRTGKIIALNVSDGGSIWERSLYSVSDYTPVVAGDLLFVVIRTGDLLALNKNTGKTVWSFGSDSLIRGSPVVVDGVLYLAASQVYAFDVLSGEVIWEHQVGNNVSQQVNISDDVLAIISSDGHVNLIDISNGKRRMTYRLWFGNTKSPQSNGHTLVLAGDKSNVIAIDLSEKDVPMEKAVRSWWRVLWKLDMASRPPLPRGFLWSKSDLKGLSAQTLAIDGTLVYIGVKDFGNQSRLIALDITDGSVVWSTQIDSVLTLGTLLNDGTITVATESGDIYSLSSDTGSELWHFAYDGELSVSPVTSMGIFIITDKEGKVTALR